MPAPRRRRGARRAGARGAQAEARGACTVRSQLAYPLLRSHDDPQMNTDGHRWLLICAHRCPSVDSRAPRELLDRGGRGPRLAPLRRAMQRNSVRLQNGIREQALGQLVMADVQDRIRSLLQRD